MRASCVGCGVCAAVCPRGVLRLENGPIAGRHDHELLEPCCFSQELGHADADQLRVFGRLEDDAVTGGDRRRHDSHADGERVIPRGYGADDAVGLVDDPRPAMSEEASPGATPAQGKRRDALQIGQVIARDENLAAESFAQRLPGLGSDELCDFLGTAGDQLPQPNERASPLANGATSPACLIRAALGE